LLWYNKFKVEKYIKPIKPIQCFNCQKFGHFSAKCEQKAPICVKCSGKHKLQDCTSEQIKCVNCKENHTSSYGGCKVYQNQVKEKNEIIKRKSINLVGSRQYSQVAADISILKDSMDKMSEEIKNFGMNIAKQVDERLNNFSTSQENLIKNQIEETYASFEQSLNFNFNEITSKAKDDLKKHTTKLLEAINDQFFEYKRNMIYCQLDILRLISPNLNQMKII
jgi:hypothetical protein